MNATCEDKRAMEQERGLYHLLSLESERLDIVSVRRDIRDKIVERMKGRNITESG